ncbi:MAG TPA: hypothetical protein VGF63_01445 [Solirubrobacteraceae bacterium]
MNERELRGALRAAATVSEDDADGAAARERSWRVVRAAYAGCAPRSRRRRWAAIVAGVALLPVAVGGAGAATTHGHDVGRWVRSVFGAGKPALVHVPGGGRLLVTGGDGVWAVSPDASRRRLGAYSGASWSPRGLFVVAWRANVLTALEPGGGERWSLSRPQAIANARWAPGDGFRVAYVAGDGLRIVNGDGTGDRPYATTQRAVAPAWRPKGIHVLAYADAGSRVAVDAVDASRPLWRSAPLPGLTQLEWSPAGGRLLAVAGRRLVLLDGASGRRLASRVLPAGAVAEDAAWAPHGSAVAIVRRRAGGDSSEVVLLDAANGLRSRVLFTAPGHLSALSWSPGGGRLLVGWPAVDEWLFLRPGDRGQPSAVSNIARQFMPGADRPRFPGAVAWCCTAAGSG